MKTKAVIFDLNGVFILSPYLSDRFQQEFGVPVEKFVPALKEIMPKVRLPNAGDSFIYWKPYLKNWGVDLNRDEFFDFWFKAEKENSEIIQLAQELKKQGIKLFILSNNFSERAEYYDKTFGFLKILFDKVYYSWETGFVKPDSRAYQNILDENGLQAEKCIYFDDSEENIESAKKLGIKSFLFKDAAGVRKKVLRTK